MRYITQIRLEGGTLHEHITRLRWVEATHAGECSRAELVLWVQRGGEARVRNRPMDVKVEVVEATPPYLRTKANGISTDNLLALPRF